MAARVPATNAATVTFLARMADPFPRRSMAQRRSARKERSRAIQVEFGNSGTAYLIPARAGVLIVSRERPLGRFARKKQGGGIRIPLTSNGEDCVSRLEAAARWRVFKFGSPSDLPRAIVARKRTQLMARQGSQRPDAWQIDPLDQIEKIQELLTVQVLDDFKNLLRVVDTRIRHGVKEGASGHPGKPLMGEQQISQRDSIPLY